jgi:FlaA1/EpsC-like NDP-sugar epimerase
MVANAERFGPRLTAKNDARITVVGQLLRWLKIDEVPQLVNVLKGDMSIIGPRPEVPDIVDLYDDEQRKALSVRPGMLGPSQITGRDELDKYPDDVDVEPYYIEHILPEKLATDLMYVENASFLNDIKYLFSGVKETVIGSVKIKHIVESRTRILYLALDTIASCISYVIAYNLRFDWAIPTSEFSYLVQVLPFVLLIRPVVFICFGLYQSLWKYIDIKDVLNVVKAASIGTVLTIFFTYVVTATGHSRSVFIIDLFLLMTIMCGFRMLYRFRLTNGTAKMGNIKNVLVVGAGDTGESLARQMANDSELGYQIVGFIDDDPRKKGMSIRGHKILGRCYDLPQIVRLTNTEEVIVAMTKATSGEMNRIIGFCEKAKVKYRIVPSVSDLISGKVYISKIRNVEVSDLLGRQSLQINISATRKLVEGKTILITGGAGSIGVELSRQILRMNPKCLVIVDKAENGLWSLKWETARAFPDAEVHYYLCEIEEKRRLREIFRHHHPHIVFHCAGLNHIPIAEGHEEKVFEQNTFDTKVVADLTKTYKAEKFILLSTDKVAYPTSVIGATKKVAELYVQKMAQQSEVDFIIIRFGTVLNSQGTFLHFFKKQLRQGGPITISDPEARGYFMTTFDAVELILQTAAMGRRGETFILDMGERVRIADIAEKLIRLSGASGRARRSAKISGKSTRDSYQRATRKSNV